MAQYKRVVIIGVGLLGGSIGKSLRQRGLAEETIGVGRDHQRLQAAVDAGAIDRASTDAAKAVQEADVLVTCVPVQRIVSSLRDCLPSLPDSAIVTDVGSTKQWIVQELSQLDPQRFCGAHPLAGSDKSGVEFANADLFEGKTTVVTPSAQTPRATLDRTTRFWESLGCRTLQMSAADHDLAIARTSHLPHILAAALAGKTGPELLPLVASGWSDTTRVASGSVEMWLQILQENKLPILGALADFRVALDAWADALQNEDLQQVRTLLQTGKNIRDSVGN